jgi:hypothetical protein|tara:strand:- start:45805 stop:46134 length:330 start_codon:yes stop_codon:yes gene_type:complete
MKKLFFLLCATTLLLVARAEAGGVWSDQYCNIETQTIITKDTNGKIISEESIEKLVCNDGAKDFLAYSGIAKECREFWFEILLSNRFVKRKGYVCQKFDGSWEIVYNPK